jgi:hypothetical protein
MACALPPRGGAAPPASPNARLVRPAVAAFALVYGIVAVAGIVDGHDAFGVIPIDTRDNVIHSIYVALALGALAADRLRTGREPVWPGRNAPHDRLTPLGGAQELAGE